MDGTSDSNCDGNDRVGLPSIVLYGVNYWVVFLVFTGDCLFWESVMTVRKFNRLDCACWGG